MILLLSLIQVGIVWRRFYIFCVLEIIGKCNWMDGWMDGWILCSMNLFIV